MLTSENNTKFSWNQAAQFSRGGPSIPQGPMTWTPPSTLTGPPQLGFTASALLLNRGERLQSQLSLTLLL